MKVAKAGAGGGEGGGGDAGDPNVAAGGGAEGAGGDAGTIGSSGMRIVRPISLTQFLCGDPFDVGGLGLLGA